MSAAGVDDKQPLGVSDDPDAIILLELGIDPKPEIGWITNPEFCRGFKQDPRKEEPQEHEEANCQEPADGGPGDAPPHFVYGIGRRFA